MQELSSTDGRSMPYTLLAMPNVTSNSILARRTATGDVLISEDVTPLRVAWVDLRSKDGQSIRVEWDARVAESPQHPGADRLKSVEDLEDARDGNQRSRTASPNQHPVPVEKRW